MFLESLNVFSSRCQLNESLVGKGEPALSQQSVETLLKSINSREYRSKLKIHSSADSFQICNGPRQRDDQRDDRFKRVDEHSEASARPSEDSVSDSCTHCRQLETSMETHPLA